MIKVVVFDLDDTLISEKDYIKSGFEHIAYIYSDKYKFNNIEVFNILMDLFNENTSNVFNRFYEKMNIEYSIEDIKKDIFEYRNHIPKIKFFEDVIPTIKDLKSKGIKLGMITDGYKETQRNKIKVLDLEKYIDYIIVTDELGREFWKPHQKSFIMMKDYFNVEYNEMVYIGDNPLKDFKAGNDLGMNTIMISRMNKIYNKIVINKEYDAKLKINNFIFFDKYIGG